MADKNTVFERAYQRLNPIQKQAVDTIEGPLMVIAGPGTGKTQVVTMRIARMLQQTDISPENILALTFTEAGATTMRQRLVQLIGSAGYRVTMGTFHAFASMVLQDHPDYFGLHQSAKPISDVQRLLLMRRLLEAASVSTLKPMNAPELYLTDIIKCISDLKRENISVTQWQEIVADQEKEFENQQSELTKAQTTKWQKQLEKWRELAVLFEAYQSALSTTHQYDYDDMISLVNAGFQNNEELKLEYQEKYQYVVVDEYQDTNAAQTQLLTNLTNYWGEDANVCVVGDPDQAIYRFQGASIENMLLFQKQYPQAPILVLDTGYRCPQSIYDAAYGLIQHNQLRAATISENADRALQSISKQSSLLSITEFPSALAEATYVVEQIEKLLEAGVNPEKIAIMYRTNKEVDALIPVLHAHHIPYGVEGGQSVLSEPALQQLIRWWQSMDQLETGLSDHDVFRLLLQGWWGIPVRSVVQLAQTARKARLSLWSTMQLDFATFDSHQIQPGLTPLEWAPLQTLAGQWSQWLRREAEIPILEWLGETILESGWLEWAKKQARWPVILASLGALQREIKSWVLAQPTLTLRDVLHHIAMYEEYRLRVSLDIISTNAGIVTLTTAHNAKGQEWDYVFIVGLHDGNWGNKTDRRRLSLPEGLLLHTDISHKDRNEDERRLLYVALTRAKKQAQLSYVTQVISGNKVKSTLPSEFISELHQWLSPAEAENHHQWLTQFQSQSNGWIDEVAPMSWVDHATLFERPLKQMALSISGLNLYLQSPRDFVYRYLLRLQEPPSANLAFGSAVHFSLEQYYKKMISGETVDFKTLLKWFEESLKQEPLSNVELERRLEYGREVLTTYYETKMTADTPQIMEIEKRFGFGGQRLMLEDIALTGKIDRLDWIDPKNKIVRIVDYKTGRPKTLGEINATVASAELSDREKLLPEAIRGPYKRQLVFYKLLTTLDPHFKAEVQDGVFEFIEGDRVSGKLVSRHLDLPDSDVELLKALIIEVMAELRSGAFLAEMTTE